jgi:formyltetrahydrofolate hydrolase
LASEFYKKITKILHCVGSRLTFRHRINLGADVKVIVSISEQWRQQVQSQTVFHSTSPLRDDTFGSLFGDPQHA